MTSPWIRILVFAWVQVSVDQQQVCQAFLPVCGVGMWVWEGVEVCAQLSVGQQQFFEIFLPG